MKRRHFVLSTLLSLPTLAFARFTGTGSSRRRKQAVVLRADQSRFDGETKTVKDAIGRCLISAADTDGNMLIMAPGPVSFVHKGGPPLHIHKYQDEVFFVAHGEFLVQVGNDVHKVATGDTVFVPRGTPHTYANPTAGNPGSLISIHQPVGKNEEFFKYLCTYGRMPDKEIDPDSPVVGPPIAIPEA